MSATVEVEDLSSATNEGEQLFKGLSWSQRIQGYLFFLSLGLFASLMSWIALAGGRYWKYTVLSTMGSLMSICSTIVIMGPMAQLGYMFDEYRRTATFLYLGSLVLSLILAFTFKSFFVCFLCGILQYGCLTWYSLSYIPYGRETVIALISRN